MFEDVSSRRDRQSLDASSARPWAGSFYSAVQCSTKCRNGRHQYATYAQLIMHRTRNSRVHVIGQAGQGRATRKYAAVQITVTHRTLRARRGLNEPAPNKPRPRSAVRACTRMSSASSLVTGWNQGAAQRKAAQRSMVQ